MLKVLKFALPALICWGLFIYVIFAVDYPDSLATASPFQLFSFFVPLFLAIIFSLNYFINYFAGSSIALGIVILLFLKAFDSLNLVTLALTGVASYLLFSYFKNFKVFKPKRILKKDLTPTKKTSKLTHKL